MVHATKHGKQSDTRWCPGLVQIWPLYLGWSLLSTLKELGGEPCPALARAIGWTQNLETHLICPMGWGRWASEPVVPRSKECWNHHMVQEYMVVWYLALAQRSRPLGCLALAQRLGPIEESLKHLKAGKLVSTPPVITLDTDVLSEYSSRPVVGWRNDVEAWYVGQR